MTSGVVDGRLDVRGAIAGARIDRRAEVSLFAVPLVFTTLHLVRGAGFLLDDWYYLRNGALDGTGGVVVYGGDRPVGRLIYTLFYGVIGQHPAPMLIVMAVMAGASAVLLARLLARFVNPWTATVAALIWLVVPSHLSLEVWPAVSQAGMAQLSCLAVVSIAASSNRSTRSTVAAAVLTVVAIWSYESIVVVLLPAVVAVQWFGARRVDRVFTFVVGCSAAVAGLWTFLHWNTDREALDTVPDLSLVLPANFGWPFTTNAVLSDLLVLVIMIGIVAVLALAIVRPGMRDPDTFGMVAVGTVILVLGTLPYVRYLYEPIGAGDRSNYLSAFGAAMILAGLLTAGWRWRRTVALGAGIVLMLLALDVRWYRTGLWSEAAADGDRIARAVEEVAEPGETVIVGPTLVIVDNITPFADGSTIRGAVQLLHGSREVDAEMVYSDEEFESYPESQRFDQRTVARLDEHER